MDDYKDIIDLPHHTSKTRPRMSIEARSAQFAPFSALTGYDEAVKEAGRRKNSKIEIDDYFKEKSYEYSCDMNTPDNVKIDYNFSNFDYSK